MLDKVYCRVYYKVMDAKEYIENVYLKAEHNVAKKELTTPPNELTKTIKAIDQIIARAESSKGVNDRFSHLYHL